MPDYLRAYAERAADGGVPGQPMRFTASTDAIARDNLIIDASAWELEPFRSNAVFIWAHDYFSRPPIGKVVSVGVHDNRLVADVVFDQGDEFARSVERKYRDGFLSAVSVGWNTLDFQPPKGDVPGRVTRAELLEISAVPVPSDPGALKERQQRAYKALGHEILSLTDDADDAPSPDPTAVADAPAERASWDDVSAEMVRLYRPHAQGPDDADRKRAYTGLARAYARCHKTPPEFIPAAALDALDVPTIRGLFLEGEPELHAALFDDMHTRAGATLSARNRDDLGRAVELIQGVLARAKKQEDESDDAERLANPLLALHALLTGDQAA